MNRVDLEQWLRSNEVELQEDVAALLPKEVAGSERKELLDGLIEATLDSIDSAIEYDSHTSDEDNGLGEEGDVESRRRRKSQAKKHLPEILL